MDTTGNIRQDAPSAAGECPAAEILFSDGCIVSAVKRPGVLSEAGSAFGMPERIAAALGRDAGEVLPVHRLDREAAGGMVYALTAAAAADLSRSIRDGAFKKVYLCLCENAPSPPCGRWTDLLYHDRVKNRSYVVKRERKGVREAVLEYETLAAGLPGGDGESLSLLRIRLLTGRTHQIRVQCASRGMPLAGDRRYGSSLPGPLELWCFGLSFPHPGTRKNMEFTFPPDRGRLAEAYHEVCFKKT